MSSRNLDIKFACRILTQDHHDNVESNLHSIRIIQRFLTLHYVSLSVQANVLSNYVLFLCYIFATFIFWNFHLHIILYHVELTIKAIYHVD